MSLRISDKFQIGKAGEHLVCADLILKNLSISMADEALPYDVLLDIGYKILKIQVKTTVTHKQSNQWRGVNEAYIFGVKRKGANSIKRYAENEVDVFALVVLETKQVGYLINGDMPTTINIRPDKFKGQYHDEKGIIKYNEVIKLKNEGKKVKEIIELTGLKETSVRNYCKKGFTPYITQALYMNDLYKERDWFLNL